MSGAAAMLGLRSRHQSQHCSTAILHSSIVLSIISQCTLQGWLRLQQLRDQVEIREVASRLGFENRDGHRAIILVIETASQGARTTFPCLGSGYRTILGS